MRNVNPTLMCTFVQWPAVAGDRSWSRPLHLTHFIPPPLCCHIAPNRGIANHIILLTYWPACQLVNPWHLGQNSKKNLLTTPYWHQIRATKGKVRSLIKWKTWNYFPYLKVSSLNRIVGLSAIDSDWDTIPWNFSRIRIFSSWILTNICIISGRNVRVMLKAFLVQDIRSSPQRMRLRVLSQDLSLVGLWPQL